MQSVAPQLQSENLSRFCVNQRKRSGETDLNDLVRGTQRLLRLLLDGNRNGDVNTTLSKKSLKIVADSARMLDALLSLVRHALDAMPDGGTCSLEVREVAFKNQSALTGDNGSYGRCASIAVTATGRGIEEKTTKTVLQRGVARGVGNGKDGNLFRAYRIIAEHHGSIRREHVAGHGTSITVYLPLVHPDDTSPGVDLTLPEGPYTL